MKRWRSPRITARPAIASSAMRCAKDFRPSTRWGRRPQSAPRLVDFSWGDPTAPKVTLVGKGVCFDTGGLDIKPPAGMLLMKKDMGGAACVLALARMVMDSALPVRLRVLIPAVENAIVGNAYRPGDVLRTRKGLTRRDRQHRRRGSARARRRAGARRRRAVPTCWWTSPR